MQTIQTVFKDTVTNRVFIGKPKVIYNQVESEKGVAFCAKNLKKVLIPTTQEYLQKQIEMYSLTMPELGFIYMLLLYVSVNNLLLVDKLPLNTVRAAQEMGLSVKTTERIFRNLAKKNVIRKVSKRKVNFYMLNPVYGCFRNNVPYETYHVFRKEINDFLSATGQKFRISNIEGYYEAKKKDIEREWRIL